MDYENTQRKFESVYSTKVRAGKRRTYFFDVRKTKGNDFYITLTESTRRFDSDGYERHKIFLYKEDFNRFLTSLGDAINHVKTELMPDYDYDEFTRRQAEWEIKRAEMDRESSSKGATAHTTSSPETITNDTISEDVTEASETESPVTATEVPAADLVDEETAHPESSESSENSEELTSSENSGESYDAETTDEEGATDVGSEETSESPAETDEEDMSW